jgi:AsmA protein
MRWPESCVAITLSALRPSPQESGAPVKKHWLRIVLIAVAVLFVILLVLPFLINVNSYRPKIETDASSALGRQVTIGNMNLSLLSGTVTADNVAIADDPAFSKSPFVTAKSLKIGVELMPLIFSKQLKITEIVLEQPQITLLRAANGKWNYSSLGSSGEKKPEEAKPGATAGFRLRDRWCFCIPSVSLGRSAAMTATRC